MGLLHPVAKARVVDSVDRSTGKLFFTFDFQLNIFSFAQEFLWPTCAAFSIATVESEFELRPKGEQFP